MTRPRTFRLAASVVLAAALVGGVHAAATAPVADAAMRRDAAAVRTLLRAGGDVNGAQGDGMTALHWAATYGDAELTEVLLYAGANVKATSRLGRYTPLHVASQGGFGVVVKALIDRRGGPECRHHHRRDRADAGRAIGERRGGDGAARGSGRRERGGEDLRADAADVCRRLRSRRHGGLAARSRRQGRSHLEGGGSRPRSPWETARAGPPNRRGRRPRLVAPHRGPSRPAGAAPPRRPRPPPVPPPRLVPPTWPGPRGRSATTS